MKMDVDVKCLSKFGNSFNGMINFGKSPQHDKTLLNKLMLYDAHKSQNLFYMDVRNVRTVQKWRYFKILFTGCRLRIYFSIKTYDKSLIKYSENMYPNYYLSYIFFLSCNALAFCTKCVLINSVESCASIYARLQARCTVIFALVFEPARDVMVSCLLYSLYLTRAEAFCFTFFFFKRTGEAFIKHFELYLARKKLIEPILSYQKL